jgi:peptidoglycan/LPS O-acetylase OafA/YrhL
MRQFFSIQVLRAFAATMVVIAHAQDDAGVAAAGAGVAFERAFPLPWAAGVDLFFVVSGFVMVYSSENLFATGDGATQFLGRRIARIVPLYWLATAIFVVLALRGAAAGRVLAPSVGEVLSSLSFLPWPRALDGAPRPVLSLGWTLEYEMFFYLVFACFLGLRRNRAVAAVAAFLVAIVAIGWFAAPQNIALAFWSDPIVLEFALGMGIAIAYRYGLRIPGLGVVILTALAVIVLALDPLHSGSEPYGAVTPNGFLRLFSWGAPMAAIFAASTLAEGPARESWMMRALARIGDASYALYLFHPLAIIVLRKIWVAAELGAHFGFWPLVPLQALAAVALSLAIHARLERPLTQLAQHWLAPRPAVAQASMANRRGV